ncbi:hypothetical protein G5V58_20510 [Nocardioides anomalus]|uniref:Uncharacterized protein n=1 Tax=Nocardioides anomalus TaxID=2712223 RepID=A0A6G6WHZ7_9ACTN|nr:hypothetical protein [Nocardioides anomalus]QIG44842.1 hypothetical protein G5V58_20510 [Nocardioides anomalus]
MLALHTHLGFGLGAHGMHSLVVGGGVVGLVALLTPRLLAQPVSSSDPHERRGPARPAPPRPVLAPGVAQQVWLPLAVVSSGAAAGVHAAVAPDHFREALVFGAFFTVCALLQLLWAGAVAVHVSRPLLLAGVVGNLAVVALWLVTRTLGLPFGLLPEPEAVGPWDVACAAWEIAVAVAAVALLRRPLPARLGDWRHWHALLPAYVAGSAVLLLALGSSGAGA